MNQQLSIELLEQPLDYCVGKVSKASHRDIHKKPFDEATITKLDVFEKYLEEWLPVAIKSKYIKHINICDFFAGTGKDINGVLGSPLRIIRILNRFQNEILSERLEINIILNEYIHKKFFKLCSCVRDEIENLSLIQELVNVKSYSKDFQVIFNEVKDDIKDQFNLVFMDQNGIKQIDNAIFNDLISFPRTDFLFFVSSSFFKRFKNEESFKKYFPNLDSKEIGSIKYSQIHNLVLSYYRNLIPKDNDFRLYPFSLEKGSNIYGLIFGSQHILGVDKFLRVAWKTNPSNGNANFDIDDDEKANQLSLFGKTLNKIEKFNLELKEFILNKRRISNREIYVFTLESGHIPKHAKEALTNFRKQGLIDFEGHASISFEACYKNNELKYFEVI